VVVAVALVGVVEAPIDQVVHMVAVGNLVVAAALAVDVGAAVMRGVAAIRVELVDRQPVLVDVVAVGVVEVAVVEKVDVAVVDDLRVAAARPVYMLVRIVNVALLAHVPNGKPPGRPAPSRW
jgi:hypothetical protein